MDVGRIFRLLRVITLLQGGRYPSASDLAGELEVSRRTVFRDLNVLEMAHIPYYFDPVQGGYQVNRHFFLPPINLTLTEALATILLAGRSGGAVSLLSCETLEKSNDDKTRRAMNWKKLLKTIAAVAIGAVVE